MRKTVLALLVLSFATSVAFAQEAPPPRRMPRTPVSRETLVAPRDPMPASRQLQGMAAIIDGEKLRVGDTDLRLFGIVPPQLAASFGPQARAELDMLANGQPVNCLIRDRDRDGRLLATCHDAAGGDMALELLKRGLAVTARGSIANTDVAPAYLAAEQAAQNAKIGIWSVSTAAPIAVITAPVATTPAPKQEIAVVEEGSKKDEKIAPRTDKATTSDAQMQAKIAAELTSQQAQAHFDESAWASGESVGFFERYQILIACVLMLTTALSIISALWLQKRRDRIDETKAVAAALRGELMAARSVCVGRAKTITSDAEDRTAVWPRIRSTLYQAYVGRIGILGAELARHVASIYGQCSDYVALYGPSGTTSDAPKKQALETLAKHIDDVLPVLAMIEKTGLIPPAPAYRPSLRSEQPKPRARAYAVSASENTALPPKEEETHSEEIQTQEEVAAVETTTPSPSNVAKASVALWENVRGFLQNHTPSAAQDPSHVSESNISEYAAMIEADMARYQYGENVENLDVTPQKKKSG